MAQQLIILRTKNKHQQLNINNNEEVYFNEPGNNDELISYSTKERIKGSRESD